MEETNMEKRNMGKRSFNPYALWLSTIKGVGEQTIRALFDTAGSAEEVYNMSQEEITLCLKDKIKKQGVAESKALSIYFAKDRNPFEEAEQLRQKGIGFVSIEDSFFPERLRGISDCPYSLYYIGSLPPEEAPSVAVIGARNCSGYGREQARIFAEKLALRGITVISGMARGVDGIAGRAAVLAGGRSYAVLGCGVDVVYPGENAELYEMLRQRGGIISENMPGTQPRSALFPRRNRLISGLADLVLVIEARRRSGTVITVDAALEQGREIFALPGRVSDTLSDGCNFLISQGAGIACTPDSVIEHFYGVRDSGTDLFEKKRKARNTRRESLSGMEKVLFDVLGNGEIMETDFLIRRMESVLGKRIGAEEFAVCMMGLQMQGLAAEIGSGHYKGIG